MKYEIQDVARASLAHFGMTVLKKSVRPGVRAELAALVSVESKGWQVLQRSLLQVFGATEEEMDLGIKCNLSHKDMCFVCEMVAEGVFASFAEAFAWVKEEELAA